MTDYFTINEIFIVLEYRKKRNKNYGSTQGIFEKEFLTIYLQTFLDLIVENIF